jgi:3-phosphoshikimate 1-carboxyvinyltransferase
LLVPESEILVRDTGVNPTRSGVIDILNKMGADIRLENIREVSGELVADISVKYSNLKGIDIKADEILRAIDEFPIICVAASCAEGPTRITGAKELRVKESDRIASMASELIKMGVAIEELEDGLVIEGTEKLQAAPVNSHGDHRIAMSLAIAGLTARGQTTISDTDCVNTSFPEFMTLIESLQH